MQIPINTDIKKFFGIYVEILNPILKLKKRERQVLSGLLAVYYANRSNKSQAELYHILFSKNVRKVIRESINMSEASYNNHINQLRTKKILIGEQINPLILKNLPSNKTLEVTYKVNIDG